MTYLPPVRRDLPASLLDVAEALGVRVALKLMQNFGGRDVKFPQCPSDDHEVVKALGAEDARALCDYLSGSQIYVPQGRFKRSKRDAVLQMEQQGQTRAQIARALGLSERHVRWLANRQEKRAELPLFPDE